MGSGCSAFAGIPVTLDVVCQFGVNLDNFTTPLVETAGAEIADSATHLVVTLVSLLGLLVFFLFLVSIATLIFMGTLSAPAGVLIIVVGLVITIVFCVGILLVIRNALTAMTASVGKVITAFKQPGVLAKLLGAG